MRRSATMPQRGTLTVYTGPMWSGKSDAMIARLEALAEQGAHVVALRPVQDDRDPEDALVSRTGRKWPCVRIPSAAAIAAYAHDPSVDVVALDEANLLQAAEAYLIAVLLDLKRRGKTVLVSGLALDYRGEPFSPMPVLMAHADVVVKLEARCGRCEEPAQYTARKVAHLTQRVLPGDDNLYEPRCCACFFAAAQGDPTRDGIDP